MFYRFIYFLVKLILMPLFRVRVHGIEKIPKDSEYIICANHKSLLDPIFVAMAVDRQVHFLAKKELFSNKFLKAILNLLEVYPVQRDGSDLKALRNSIKILKSGKVLGIFPEGTRVKEINRENIKDGAGFIALKSKTNILTIEIVSSYKPFRKTDLYIKDEVRIKDYKDLKSKEAMVKIMDDTFDKMYEEHRKLRKV